MVELYIKQQIMRLYRIMRQLGPFVSVLILYIVGMLLLGVYKLPEFYAAIIYFSLVLFLHISRRDKCFLQSVYGMTYRKIYFVENLLIAIPFVIICIIKAYLEEIPLIFITSFLIAWIPKKKLNIHFPTNPLLTISGYEFRRAFRICFLEYISLLIVSILGLLYENIKIAEVALALFVFSYISFLLVPNIKEYMFNFRSRYSIIRHICITTFSSAFVLLMPFLLLFLINQLRFVTLFKCCMAYVAVSFLFIQVEVLRLNVKENEFIFAILLMVIFILSIVSTFLVYMLFISFLLTVLNFIYLFHKIKIYFVYDRN